MSGLDAELVRLGLIATRLAEVCHRVYTGMASMEDVAAVLDEWDAGEP